MTDCLLKLALRATNGKSSQYFRAFTLAPMVASLLATLSATSWKPAFWTKQINCKPLNHFLYLGREACVITILKGLTPYITTEPGRRR